MVKVEGCLFDMTRQHLTLTLDVHAGHFNTPPTVLLRCGHFLVLNHVSNTASVERLQQVFDDAVVSMGHNNNNYYY